jgi:hypothetical protein
MAKDGCIPRKSEGATEQVPAPAPAAQEVWCLWCGMTIRTAEDEVQHREQCPAERGEAPSPAEYIAAVRGTKAQ